MLCLEVVTKNLFHLFLMGMYFGIMFIWSILSGTSSIILVPMVQTLISIEEICTLRLGAMVASDISMPMPMVSIRKGKMSISKIRTISASMKRERWTIIQEMPLFW